MEVGWLLRHVLVCSLLCDLCCGFAPSDPAIKQGCPPIPPRTRLSRSFVQREQWVRVANRRYGIAYAHPKFWTVQRDMGANMLEAKFSDNGGAVLLAEFDMPKTLFRNSNFVTGAFAIYVNPRISSAAGCADFPDREDRYVTRRSVRGIPYQLFRRGGAAAGTISDAFEFHTFQHAMCFQVSLVFATWTTANADYGCTIASLRDSDEEKVVGPFIREIAFVPRSEMK